MKPFSLVIFLLCSAFSFLTFAAEKVSRCSELSLWGQNPQWNAPSRRVKADYVLVDKTRRLMHIFENGELVKTNRVALGASAGRKRKEGDWKTPEGIYHVDQKRPDSDYHRGLHIDYPNAEDIAYAEEHGWSPGSDILLHGLPNNPIKRALTGHPNRNWTRGCVALSDDEIDQLYEWTSVGLTVEICP
jgi:murein L,D-transpeptidase YafK